MATMSYPTAPGSAVPRGGPTPVSNAPAGTFTPGTKVQVGSHRVVIEKYLSEGGFAHVYVVRVPVKADKYEVAVLKRVAVPDKDSLASMRTEVETMKKLKGHTYIVRYMDSHASQLKGGGYEVFLLMEFCAGGGLIDFMNTRLQYRLTEPEILNIFSDVALGVAAMHYLKPPLLHRDLKVENVLISKPASGGADAMYKLCDFGSTAPPRPAATNASEARLIEDDIQRHTTVQYRSPEMIDVWRKQPIDEKSDIWALGVLLYKLCYYTTPFEEVGQMAILNAKFKFPSHPFFSQKLRGLISAMLMEDPKQRPNIFLVVQTVCSMRGIPLPIKDIYTNRTRSEDQRNQTLPPTSPQIKSPPPGIGLVQSPPEKIKEALPDITPMRRGRPTAQVPPSTAAKAATPSAAARAGTPTTKGDPFAALDSTNITVRAVAIEDLAKKFPSLDEFSIAIDKKQDFVFSKPNATAKDGKEETAKKLTGVESKGTSSTAASSGAKTFPSKTTSAPPKPVKLPDYANRPIWRVPEKSQAELLPSLQATNHNGKTSPSRDSRSLQPSPKTASPTSSKVVSRRRTPSPDSSDDSVRAAPTKHDRHGSNNFVGSNLDYLRDHETHVSQSPPTTRQSSSQRLSTFAGIESRKPIDNDTAYLQSLEESDDTWERQRLNQRSELKKTLSVPLVKATTAKLIEIDSPIRSSDSGESADALKRSHAGKKSIEAASTASSTSARPHTGDVSGLEETQDLPSEMRREMERQVALQEEARVIDPSAGYPSRTEAPPQNSTRASTIQQRVQALLDEGRSSPVQRTASGYGHYTDTTESHSKVSRRPLPPDAKVIAPVDYARSKGAHSPAPRTQQSLNVQKQRPDPRAQVPGQPPVSASAPPATVRAAPPKPMAKPKPVGLRGTMTGQQPPVKGKEAAVAEWQNAASSQSQGSRLAALIARDNEGVAEAGAASKVGRALVSGDGPVDAPGSAQDRVVDEMDLESDFSRRYPSLGGMDLVQADPRNGLGAGPARREMRIRDV